MAADDDTDEAKRKHRSELEALILLLLASLHGIGNSLTPGNVGSFAGLVTAALNDAHVMATVVGRRAAGDDQPVNDADVAFGYACAAHDDPYLAKFVTDLADGRYADADGSLLTGAINTRLGLYAHRVTATANEAWVASMPDTTRYRWRLGKVETVHCDVCPKRAKGGPYTRDTLPGYPGDGSSPCRTLCKCWLEAVGSEQEPFKP